jgi:hypothetical protein
MFEHVVLLCRASVCFFFIYIYFVSWNHQTQLTERTCCLCCNLSEDKSCRRNQPTKKCSEIQYKRFYCGLTRDPTTWNFDSWRAPYGEGVSLNGATWRHTCAALHGPRSLTATCRNRDRRWMECGHRMCLLLPLCFTLLNGWVVVELWFVVFS